MRRRNDLPLSALVVTTLILISEARYVPAATASTTAAAEAELSYGGGGGRGGWSGSWPSPDKRDPNSLWPITYADLNSLAQPQTRTMRLLPFQDRRFHRRSLGLINAKRLYESARFGRKRKRMMGQLLKQMGLEEEGGSESGEGGGGGGKISEEKLRLMSKAVDMWEFKLSTFASKFAHAPEVLESNPTWHRLLRVRDSLRQMLLKAELQALDQTRM